MIHNNNIPQGYKQTELGIIPEDWNIKSIGEFLSIGNGHDYKGKSFGNIPVYGTGGIITHIDDYLYDGQTICIGRKGTIDKPIFHSGKIWTVDTLYYTYNFIDIEVKFIYYLLLTIDWMSLNEATGVPSLTSDRIKQITLALPPIAEQRAIAEALSDVDRLIAALDKKIAKKRLLTQGAMQQLLTGKKRLPGFTDEWVEKKVKDVFRVTRGYVLATNKVVERPDGYYKYPVFSSQTQNNGVMGYYSDYLFEDAITWTTDGANAGEVNYRQGKFYCTNVCGVLISEEGYANECVASIINMVAKSHVSYIGNPKLMNNVMADIEICIPPSIKEQQAIATILSDMDKEIADLEAQRDKYRLLKSGMMQKLLTGQIRLKTE